MRKKALSLALSLSLVFGMAPVDVSASAITEISAYEAEEKTTEVSGTEEGISYLAWSEEDQKLVKAAVTQHNNVSSEDPEWSGEMNAGWYVVSEDCTIESRVETKGDIHLLLCDGVTLTVKGGITVAEDGSLTIYAQSEGEEQGALTITDVAQDNAGIGSGYYGSAGEITINGGSVEATGGKHGAGIGSGYYGNAGEITINGGSVEATGGEWGAGIGSGYSGSVEEITINGGNVEVTGGDSAAGIGSGFCGSVEEITINGGSVEATSEKYGAGIGSGTWASVGNIIINEGSVEAAGGDSGAGIGNSTYGSTEEITINGGSVEAAGGSGAAGIGSGNNGSVEDIIIKGGGVEATGGNRAAGIGSGFCGSVTAINISGGTVAAYARSDGDAVGDGDYPTKGVTSITLGGASVKASTFSVTPVNSDGAELLPLEITNASGVRSLSVDEISYSISGNHKDDTSLYLYLTKKDHEAVIVTEEDRNTHFIVYISDQFLFKNVIDLPVIEGWQYGDTANAPAANALYGVAEFEYSEEEYGEYTQEVPSTAGIWYVKAVVAEGENYTGAESAPVQFEITKAPLTVTIEEAISVYGEPVVNLTADDHEGILNGDTEVYELTTAASATSDAGTYDITGIALNPNYDITFENEEDAYEILPRPLMVEVHAMDKAYDGTTDAVIAAALTGVAEKDAGEIALDVPFPQASFVSADKGENIEIIFSEEFRISGAEEILKNYVLTQPDRITGTITNDWNPAKGVEYTAMEANENGWFREDFVITAKDGYELSRSNTADGDWTAALTGEEEGSDGRVVFYTRNRSTGAISEEVTETYQLDKNTEETKTTGTVSIGEKQWQTFVAETTWDLFFNEEVTVSVSAEDLLSGVETIEYCEADRAMTLEEVQDITDWMQMPEEGVKVGMEEGKTFVYYVRITDQAGNVTYFSTDGAEYDTAAPVITGVEAEETYYTTQVVSVADKNLAEVTVNGEPAVFETADVQEQNVKTVKLAGNTEAVYTIKATDQAGNETTITVNMKTIDSIKDLIRALTEANVCASDQEAVQKVLAQVEKLLADIHLTEEEKQGLEALEEAAGTLMAKIRKIQEMLSAEEIKAVEEVTEENVTAAKKEALEMAKEALKKVLEDYAGNLTESEKTAVAKEIGRIEAALEKIQEIEEALVSEEIKVVEDITEETVTAAYKEALETAKEALKKVLEYYGENLTESEKITVTKEISRIEAALTKIDQSYPTGIVRLAGEDRYETAFETAEALKEAWNVEKFEAAIITTGKEFADALSGSYLAAVKYAPILLTNGKENNVKTLVDYIKANVAEGSTVYILGGENAVTTALDTIEGYEVKRLSGNDRYETNLQILEEAGIDGQEELIVATGKEFADGLCAAATARPILLVKKGRVLTEEQKAIVGQFKAGKIYILGGESAVDADLEIALKAVTETEEVVIRLSGDSRYETSVKVAETFFEAPRAVIAAYGKNFPDGLCGGPLSAALNIPLILTRDGYTEDGAAYIKAQNVTSGYVLGGTDVLSEETVGEVFAAEVMAE